MGKPFHDIKIVSKHLGAVASESTYRGSLRRAGGSHRRGEAPQLSVMLDPKSGKRRIDVLLKQQNNGESKTAGSSPPVHMKAYNGSALRHAIAVLVKNFEYGGAQRQLLRLANKLHEFGHDVHVLSGGSGPLQSTLRDGIRTISLERGSQFAARLLAWRAIPSPTSKVLLPLVSPIIPLKGLALLAPLTHYLRDERPSVMISATPGFNVIATLAKRLADAPTGLVLREGVLTNQRRLSDRRFVRRYLADLMRYTYRDADAIVGNSTAVAGDLRVLLQVPDERIHCIFNSAVPDNVRALAAAPVEHPWFGANQLPVVLAAGRPSPVKGFPMLLRAFADLRRTVPARLVILCSAKPGSTQQNQYLDELRELATELGVAEHFAILDFTANPFAYMARAGVFALSSTSEGFGNVVAESLACGCPVVSTRAGGPIEVLEDGRYGRLVDVGDTSAMAAALGAALRAPRNSDALVQRARIFSEERIARAYEALCCEIRAKRELQNGHAR